MTGKETIIYLAGLIDGEGSINITQYKTQGAGNTRWRPSIRLQMTDLEPVKLFAETFGFHVYQQKKKTIGGRTVYGCDAAWHGCRRILEEIFPYLVAKREIARIVIDFCFHMESYKRETNLAKRRKGGQLINGRQISYQEAKYRYDIYCKVKSLVQAKSISSHRKRLSEETLKELKELWGDATVRTVGN